MSYGNIALPLAPDSSATQTPHSVSLAYVETATLDNKNEARILRNNIFQLLNSEFFSFS